MSSIRISSETSKLWISSLPCEQAIIASTEQKIDGLEWILKTKKKILQEIDVQDTSALWDECFIAVAHDIFVLHFPLSYIVHYRYYVEFCALIGAFGENHLQVNHQIVITRLDVE